MVKANKQGTAAVKARREIKACNPPVSLKTRDGPKYSDAPEMTRKA